MGLENIIKGAGRTIALLAAPALLAGCPTQPPAPKNSYIRLDGVNGQVQIADLGSLLGGYRDFTISMWVRQHQYEDKAGLLRRYEAAEDDRALLLRTAADNSINVLMSETGEDLENNTSTTDRRCGIRNNEEWTYVGLRKNDGVITYLRNGASCDIDESAIEDLFASFAPLSIGRGNNGDVDVYLNADVDEVVVHDRALSDEEHFQQYNQSDYSSGPGQPVLALTYHTGDPSLSVTPQAFAEQMEYLDSAGFTTITAREFADWQNGRIELPEKPVIIFVDDGRKQTINEALPIMKQHGFVGNLAVVSDYANGSLGDSYMNWEQINTLVNEEGWDIVSHSKTHPDMRLLSPEQTNQEFVVPRNEIESHTGVAPSQFVFPFSAANQTLTDLCAQAGYVGCWTRPAAAENPAYLDKQTEGDRYGVFRRVNINGETDFGTFKSLFDLYNTSGLGANLENGKVLELLMNEGEGTITTDSSGFENHGILRGGASWGEE